MNARSCALAALLSLLTFAPSSAQHGGAAMPQSQPAHTNRLIDATSPYLLQHAHNPVDWYEWGPEALERARAQGKPIFLSIGYSACHWCHVMAHESFENEEIAAVMNALFVNIKVDREERPDLDEIYMRATVIMNQGQGGWPMSVWLTPDLKPFFAGTYFPPEQKWGRPGFRQICERIGELWGENRAGLESDAQRLTDAVASSLQAPASAGEFDLRQVDQACRALGQAFDAERGGISGGGPNKFPPSMTLELFLRFVKRHGRDEPDAQRLLDLTQLTLDQMADGGIYDHLGGGICRYSTDVEWHVPHFEKMLYDQALVARIYADAFVATRAPRYRAVASDICDYVLRDLRAPGGGFYSSRDADSEGEEGRFYVWTRAEVLAALPADQAELFCRYYDVSESGNWSDPHAPGVAKNVLRITRPLAEVAAALGVSVADAERQLAAARRTLFERREGRTHPGRDEKVLVEWNGLMISALARGGAAFDEPKYIAAACDAAGFLLEHQWVDGRLRRAWRDGRRLEMAFLTDYACLIEGLLDLYEATFERRWYDAARALTAAAIEHFADDAVGGFYFTADDHEELITRTKDARDGATPSGNSVMLLNLLRLAAMTGDVELATHARRTMDAFHGDVTQSLGAAERFLAGVEYALVGPTEFAVVGAPGDDATRALLRTIRATWTPNRVVMLRDPAQPEAAPDTPLLAERPLVGGRPAVYVCRNYACQRPVTTPEQLAQLLATAEQTSP